MHKSLKKTLYIFLILLLVYMSLPTSGTWFYLNHVRWLYVLIFSFLGASILTPVAIYIANKKKIYDYPDERKIHSKPIPRLGGLAIYVGLGLQSSPGICQGPKKAVGFQGLILLR